MATPSEGEAVMPLPRPHLTIVYYDARCNECEFSSRRSSETLGHSIAMQHSLTVIKRYKLEPPE